MDAELGLQHFDLIAPNDHLHHDEVGFHVIVVCHCIYFCVTKIMRDIISQITALWNICRKESKNSLDSNNQSTINDRTWRPWVGYRHSVVQELIFFYLRNISMH